MTEVLAFDILAVDKASEVFGKVGEAGEGTAGKLAKIGAAVGGVFAVAEGVNYLKGALSAAAEEGQNMAVLNHTLDENLHTTEAQKSANEKWITSLQNATGVSRDELEPALGKLVISGMSLTQAQKDMAVATDIAAARHIDLATVVAGVAKAATTGQTTALARMGLATKDAAGHTLTLDQILQQASKTMGGSAAAAADTAAGRAQILGEKFKDLKVQIGTALLPVMDKLTSGLSVVVGFLADRLPPAIASVQKFLAPFVADVKLAAQIFESAFNGVKFADDTGWIGAVEKAATVAKAFADWIQGHLEVVLVGLGITVGLLVAPFVTVVAGLVYAYTQFQVFRDVVDAVASFLVDKVVPVVVQFAGYIVEQFSHVVAWVQQYWPQISEAVSHVINVVKDIITVYTAVISAIWSTWGDSLISIAQAAWQLVQTTVSDAIRVIQDVIAVVLAVINGDWGKAWDGIKDIVATVWKQIGAEVQFGIDVIVGLLGGVGRSIASVTSGMWDGIKDAFKAAINAVIDLWNGLAFPSYTFPKISTPLGDIGGETIGGWHLPHIDRLHSGGTFHASAGEGLALLRDNEVVTTPEDMGSLAAKLDALIAVAQMIVSETRNQTQTSVLLART